MSPKREPVVSLLTKRTRVALEGYDTALSPTERVLSPNAVTGWSVNVPIEATCQPSKHCASTCYAASNLMAATPALLRQARVLRAMREDPAAFAKRVCDEYDALGLTFVRWNGVGDLDEAAVEAINWIGANRPDVVVWVVTRIAQHAAKIAHAPGVFVHFSLDATSRMRRLDFLSKAPLNKNYFFSWQCERGEVPPENHGASVVFAHRYKVAEGVDLGAASCPLNGANDCAGMCSKCRRCFNGEAVRLRVELANWGSHGQQREGL